MFRFDPSICDPSICNCSNYYGNWAAGQSFAISAWLGSLFDPPPNNPGEEFQAVGDPFLTK